MDRYALISIDKSSVQPELIGMYYGEEGCENAHETAERLAAKFKCDKFIVVGL